MHKFGKTLVLVTAGLLTVLAPMSAVAAAAPAAAPTQVLTLGALAAAPVNVGDLLTSSLTPGSTLSITAAAGGGVGLFCSQSVWGGRVLANPAAPGGTAVIQLLNPFTISACTDNSPTVTGVAGVAVSGLPDNLQVTSNPTYPLRILPTGAPLQIAVTLNVVGPATVVCTYQAVGVVMGNTTAGSNPWRFTNQPFQLTGGPLPACGTGPTSFFSAAYSPVIDTTVGGMNVFVN
jgi:hypothetical protein